MSFEEKSRLINISGDTSAVWHVLPVRQTHFYSPAEIRFHCWCTVLYRTVRDRQWVYFRRFISCLSSESRRHLPVNLPKINNHPTMDNRSVLLPFSQHLVSGAPTLNPSYGRNTEHRWTSNSSTTLIHILCDQLVVLNYTINFLFFVYVASAIYWRRSKIEEAKAH